MTPVLTYPVVGQSIAEALCAEERGDGPEQCYRRYLTSLRDIFILLENEVNEDSSSTAHQWPLDSALSLRQMKFLGLAQRCLERTIDQLKTTPSATSSATSSTSNSYSSLPIQFNSLPSSPPKRHSPTLVRNTTTRRVSSLNEPVNSLRALQQAVESSPRISTGIESPMEVATRQNRALIATFKRRIQSGRFTASQLSQLNLSLQRNITENISIARSKEESFGKRIEAQISDQQNSIESNRLQHPYLFSDNNLFQLFKSSVQFEFHFLTQDTWFQRCKSSRRDSVDLSFAYILRLSQHPIHETLCSLIERYIIKYSELSISGIGLDTTSFTELSQTLMTELDKIAKIFSLILSGDASSLRLRDRLLHSVLPGRLQSSMLHHLSLDLRDSLFYLQEQMDLPMEKQIDYIGLKIKYAFLEDPSAYEEPVKELVSVINPVLPSEKLSVLNAAVTSLVHYVRNRMPEGSKGVGADELLPVLCYVLLRSRHPALLLHCKMLEGLVMDEQIDGAEGYTLTTFITAATFCSSRPEQGC